MGLFNSLIDKALEDVQYKADHRSFGGNIKESPYTTMSHAELAMLRDKADAAMQPLLAPYEHRAFAREWTQENPMLAAPSLAAAAPLYYVAKQKPIIELMQRFGWVGKDATPASLDQLIQSYKGIAEGLTNTLRTGGTNTGTSTTGLFGSLLTGQQ